MLVAISIDLIAFQSTLPARGATIHPMQLDARHPISIHAPRTGSDLKIPNNRIIEVISIHAPRTGSDKYPVTLERYIFNISIHAPRTGSD